MEGGPTYELPLKGEASKFYYQFSKSSLDLGYIPYDQVHTAEIILYNRGKVDFQFDAVDIKENITALTPGEIIVSPSRGFLPAHENVTITVTILPGIPEKFSKSFKFQVAYFDIDVINVFGEAVYPKIFLDLPRDLSDVDSRIHKEAVANMDGLNLVKNEQTRWMTDEIDRLLVKQFAIEHVDKFLLKPIKARPRFVGIIESFFVSNYYF